MFHNCFQHISDPKTGSSRDRHRISDSKIIKLIDVRHIFFKIIYLVYYKDDRLSGTPEHIRHFRIRIYKALSYVSDKNDHICSLDCNLCLFPHLGEYHVFTVRLDTSGVDHSKFFIQPCHVRIDPVSCDSRRIFHD